MQSRSVEDMADYTIDKMCDYFQEKVKDFVISDLIDDMNYRSFIIEFNAYNYFPMRFCYDKGRISCGICFGTRVIRLNNRQKWWEEIDLEVYFKELQSDIELRIPDKYLKAHGWL